MDFLKKILRFFKSPKSIYFKILISGLLVFLIAKSINFDKILVILKNVSPIYLLVLLLLVIVKNYLQAWRFKVFTAWHLPTNIHTLCKQYLISSMYSIFLPSTLGGEGVRLFMLSNIGFKKSDAGFFILFERLLGLYVLLFIALIASFCYNDSIDLITQFLLVGIVSFSIILYVLIFLRWQKIFQKFPTLQSKLELINTLSKNKATLVKTVLLGFPFQFTSILATYIVAIAFNINLNFWCCFIYVPIIWLITILPISLGGLGIREGSFIYFFSKHGLSNEEILILSIGTYFSFILNGVVGFLLYLLVQVNTNKEKKD